MGKSLRDRQAWLLCANAKLSMRTQHDDDGHKRVTTFIYILWVHACVKRARRRACALMLHVVCCMFVYAFRVVRAECINGRVLLNGYRYFVRVVVVSNAVATRSKCVCIQEMHSNAFFHVYYILYKYYRDTYSPYSHVRSMGKHIHRKRSLHDQIRQLTRRLINKVGDQGQNQPQATAAQIYI